MNAGRHRAHGPDGRKERDDDLVLFRELFKVEEQRNVSLLQHESDDFETASGNYPLYRMPSVKKGAGYDFLAVDSEKNDYDWLKTPPGTPLFPSLEMESKAPSMVLYNEIPILQPLKTSRFAGKPEGPKPGHRPKSSGSRSTASTYSDSSSSRSVTPNKRPISSSAKSTTPTATTLKEALNLKQRPKQSISSYTKQSNLTVATRAAAAAAARPSSGGSTTTTPKKQNTDTKPLSRGVSPFVRTREPATLPGFTDETPPNVITSTIPGRALSASRCRPGNPVLEPKAEAGKPRRQSCSPSVNRGRKVAEISRADGGRAPAAAGGNLLVGSRMVEKLMNARRSDAVGEEKRDLKPKQRVAAAKEGAGFGRLMSRASLDVALKHMEIRKLPSDNQQNTGRAKGSSLTSSIRSTGGDETSRNLWGRRSN